MRNIGVVARFSVVLVLMLLVGCGVEESTGFDGMSAFGYTEEQVSFGPRFPGSSGHTEEQLWISATLEDLGWEIETQHFTHLGLELTNFIARLPGQSNSQSPILLGAHYDTRPHADQDLDHPDQPVLGANDGASGVAVLMELARILPQNPPAVPVWLVFFDGEDSGNLNGWEWIVGSTYFADHLTIEPQAVVIIDMVGDADLQLFFDRNSNPELSLEIWAIGAELDYDSFIAEYKYSMIDDHTPFTRLGIPAVDIIDFDYPAWHTTEDTLDKISPNSLEQVGQTVLTWLYRQTE
jgi:glutaminyl-peptide cyclotransferase